MKIPVTVVAIALALAGCSDKAGEPASTATNVLELGVEGMTFTGPDTIKSGWTTIRITNDGGMPHFGLVYRLPEGVTARMVDDQLVRPFQASLTARLAGDDEEADRLLGTFPEWVADLVWLGGPGMMSDGVTGEATMYLEPGNYIVECYVKTNGVQHNYNPEPGQFGMVHALTVLPEDGGMAEPEANVTLELTNTGYRIADGAFRPGENSVRARFVEQQLYNNFVGHDAHVFRIDEDTDAEAAAGWVDFFPVDGQQTPAPAHFLGGIHDMPQGATGYFKLDLAPGEYGITAEIPDAVKNGHFSKFTVD
ncbi:hypothetical protein [Qipengyuania sphaerica]|uniref:hypothetical protein n=1 Tax=Qipengyuania sphaerica TaxID=2867243 RepID=UPI001C897561|nr:hypothetical protein [Qipengyuania sphaerica]MBX7541823.1 hypothetical protein [Qipengyuania sphaerica]